jgi:hypothetical protein
MFLTLLPYLTVVANLALVLGILFTVSQRVRHLASRSSKHEMALQQETARLAAEIAELKNQILELELPDNSLVQGAVAQGAAVSSGNSANTMLRSKVLKMHRLGQSPDRIAGALRVPKGEVDLLVKVHQIVMRPYEEVILAPMGGEAAEIS